MDEKDDRILAWERVAGHPFFEDAYAEEKPLIESMLNRLDRLMATPKRSEIAQAEEPVEWRIIRAFTNGYTEGMRRALDGRLDR